MIVSFSNNYFDILLYKFLINETFPFSPSNVFLHPVCLLRELADNKSILYPGTYITSSKPFIVPLTIIHLHK